MKKKVISFFCFAFTLSLIGCGIALPKKEADKTSVESLPHISLDDFTEENGLWEEAVSDAHSSEKNEKTPLVPEPDFEEPSKEVDDVFISSDITWVSSTKREKVEIPVYITTPVDYKEGKSYPVVLLFPGLNGNHDNGGGFAPLIQEASQKGYLTLTIDFSGCGNSKEVPASYSITEMKQDTMDAIQYLNSHYQISEYEGIGYSIGGRLILEMIQDGLWNPSRISLIAPAVHLRCLQNALGGEDNWNEMVRAVTNDGHVLWGSYDYGIQFFTDLWSRTDGIADAAAEKFSGKAQVIYSNDDPIIENAFSIATAQSLNASTYELSEGGHSYGFDGNYPELAVTVNEKISSFIF